VLPPIAVEEVTFVGLTATLGLLMSTPEGSWCDGGGAGIAGVDVGNSGTVTTGGASSSGSGISGGGCVGGAFAGGCVVGGWVVGGGVVDAGEPGSDPDEPPPPQATTSVAIARAMSVFLYKQISFS
jgi:hypothetical protein